MDSDSDSDSEDEMLCVLAAVIIKKKKQEQTNRRRRHKTWVRDIYRERDEYGVSNLVTKMRISNREQYFK